MSPELDISRRLLRKELRASRAVPAGVVAGLGVVLLLALLVSAVAWAVDGRFRVAATAWIDGATALAMAPAAMIGAGIVVVVLAVVLLLLAVVPGHRARHARAGDRSGLVIDDGVLADAIADAVARRVAVPRARVGVTVSRRTTSVRITPTSGVAVDREAAADAARRVSMATGFDLAPRVFVAEHGVIA